MSPFALSALHSFILRAKRACYVGSGQPSLSYRQGSHDLQFTDGEWAYHDSYFGGTNFLGEEVVYFRGQPVWAENYFGRVLNLAQITGAQAGEVIKVSLTKMYAEERFLGGFEHAAGDFTYYDTSEGDVSFFTGREWITRGGEKVYELVYHGGLIKD